MARWTPSLHPRDARGRWRNKGGGGGSGPKKRRTPTHELPLRKIKLQGKGYDKVPNRREIRQAVLQNTARTAAVGLIVAGPKGALVGGGIGLVGAGSSIARRTRNTKRRLAGKKA